jgi:hypothetical protein
MERVLCVQLWDRLDGDEKGGVDAKSLKYMLIAVLNFMLETPGKTENDPPVLQQGAWSRPNTAKIH